MRFDVRRLAAVDMHGPGAVPGRRPVIILSEFLLGALGCTAVGVLTLVAGKGNIVFGWWLAGVGLNYAALAGHAIILRRPGRLTAELADVDLRKELKYYSLAQLIIAVPIIVFMLALPQFRRHLG